MISPLLLLLHDMLIQTPTPKGLVIPSHYWWRETIKDCSPEVPEKVRASGGCGAAKHPLQRLSLSFDAIFQCDLHAQHLPTSTHRYTSTSPLILRVSFRGGTTLNGLLITQWRPRPKPTPPQPTTPPPTTPTQSLVSSLASTAA